MDKLSKYNYKIEWYTYMYQRSPICFWSIN